MRADLHVCAKKLLLSLAVCTAMIAPNAVADNAMRNILKRPPVPEWLAAPFPTARQT